ncbi:ATPase, T2SS/T4P/T4SS family [Nocardioides zeae]|uniref:ATPase, T2SS/T4P/T4SS family n=1 Tax=Nocardioides imazamoxiresistens TaxID=3231893 RepID=A0ABU3PQW0_9ACTN|nr:ATPase, T2SS/T4P/T4SS family [Nocardioides zeae]MDT9591618.1 ATPase, T2SS/T4P/T4SS family [Nocardioides zeae]
MTIADADARAHEAARQRPPTGVRPLRPAPADVVDALDARVRELVRAHGVDPQRDGPAVRRLAEDAAREHDDRALAGTVARLADPAGVVAELVARVAGFGPLQAYLDDPTVEEIWINDPSRVFVARDGRHELTPLMLSHEQVAELVERMLKTSGRRLDISRPFVDATLPDGHRLHVVLEGISRGFTAVNIRKFLLKAATLGDLVELRSLTPQAAAFLTAAVRAGLNVLVAGGTQAGKTTMLNCLAAAIPGGDRVVSAEEVFELRFPHPECTRGRTCRVRKAATDHPRRAFADSCHLTPKMPRPEEVRATPVQCRRHRSSWKGLRPVPAVPIYLRRHRRLNAGLAVRRLARVGVAVGLLGPAPRITLLATVGGKQTLPLARSAA